MWFDKKEKCVKDALVVGGKFTNNETGESDEISGVVAGGFKLKKAGGPFTKAWIFKYYRIS